MSAVQSYNWFYDYSIVLKNDASCLVEFRQYSSQSIPSTVPWKPYMPGMAFPRLAPSGSTAYWSFNTFNPSASIMADLSGNGHHLTNNKSSVDPNALWVSRRDPAYQPILGGGSTGYNLISVSPVDFSDTSFSWETYIYGIDSTTQASNLSIFNTGSSGPGYGINFDFVNNILQFQVSGSNPSPGVVTASLAAIRQESGLPPNYHYFAGSYVQGQGLYLYIDGQPTSFVPYTNGVQASGNNLAIKNGNNLFVDEFVIYGGYLDPNTVSTKYLMTKERQRYLGMPKGSYYPYHQARFTVFAEGSNEFELHAFSIRGLQNTSASILDPRLTDLYVTPFFSSVTGSVAQEIGGIYY
jgi:hypothetical protein